MITNAKLMIRELQELLKNGGYQHLRHEFDKLADSIRVEEKDDYYRYHPEETKAA